MMKKSTRLVLVGLTACVLSCTSAPASDELPGGTVQQKAAKILKTTGVRGGLIVHAGCGDGKLTAALHDSGGCLVQGLDADAGNVDAARRHIQSLGLYGKVSVTRWSVGPLPYIDNLVKLLVVSPPASIPREEMLRVLCPGGVAVTLDSRCSTLASVRKPWPETIDPWTHYLHDPTGNAVAHDQEIGFPKHLQWIAGPRYSRQHDHMSSVSGMVTAGGRTFAIVDEGRRESILTPPDWQLVARDAFSGVLLWKQPIARWHTQLWPLKSGPQPLPRRLVAVGDWVYATLGIDAPVARIDAASGKLERVYEQTRATEEILAAGGTLYLVVADLNHLRSDPYRAFASVDEIKRLHTEQSWGPEPRTVMAVNADTGETTWQAKSNVTPMTLAADDGSVYFHDGEKIVSLNRRDGKQRWASEPIPLPEFMASQGAVVLVVYDDVVLFAGGKADGKPGDRRGTGLCAVSAKDGRKLWSATQAMVWQTLRDVLVMQGLVWSGAMQSGSGPGLLTGRDPHTGEVKKEFACDADIFWFHHRCYRAKATDRYLLYSRNGIEFVDPQREHWTPHHWVRGACLYGIMPANGLVYSPPHPCSCYSEAKLYGFNALAAERSRLEGRESRAGERLERGPAYDPAFDPGHSTLDSCSWPTYRHDPARSGATSVAVPADDLKSVWQTAIGGRLSSPTVANGEVYVAAIDQHTVNALDAENGKPAWTFTAGGRVDSPPTVWNGRVLFGSADGFVYCLRADDGQLAWRFRAAPADLRLGAFDQIESVWPVHGAVLIQNDTVYCVAGRSMFVDGGMRLLRLDPASGRLISETVLDDRDPATGESLLSHVSGLNMPVAMSDVLSSDGRYVYMRSLPFDLEGRRRFVEYVDVADQRGDDVHLFSPTGFLDDTMWHRTYWVYGRAWASGAGGYYQAGQVVPSGRLLVCDKEKVYGYGRLPQYFRWTTPLEFHLYAMDKQAEVVQRERVRLSFPQGISEAERKRRRKAARANQGPPSHVAWQWSDSIPVQVCAMVKAADLLFVAGPPDVLDEEDAVQSLSVPDTQQRMAEQNAAFAGKRGAILLAVSAKDGQQQAAYGLASMPRFDGLAAADGCLYLATSDGKLQCLGHQAGSPLPEHKLKDRGGSRQEQVRRAAVVAH